MSSAVDQQFGVQVGGFACWRVLGVVAQLVPHVGASVNERQAVRAEVEAAVRPEYGSGNEGFSHCLHATLKTDLRAERVPEEHLPETDDGLGNTTIAAVIVRLGFRGKARSLLTR